MNIATATAGGQHWATALHPCHALHPWLHHLSACSSMGLHLGIFCLTVSGEGSSLSKSGPSSIMLLLSSCHPASQWPLLHPGTNVVAAWLSREELGRDHHPTAFLQGTSWTVLHCEEPLPSPPTQLPWNLVRHNAGGCKIKQPWHLTVSSSWFALLVYCEANWHLAMVCLKFQNSVWVCTEIKKLRKEERKGWSQSMATASFFFLPLNPCWHNAEYCQRFLFYFSNQYWRESLKR